MSVYIKGMEMPKKGCIKMLILLDNGYVIETTPGCDPQPENQNYTAIPVPEHGDLIDRDKLEKDIDKYIGGEESRSRFHHWVQVQRSVIPKSEEAQT